MSDVFVAILAFVAAIGILVAVHEFGHFWVARKLGIKVLRFSIGFGKPIWRKVSGADQTEYVISNIPLGGYVKMLDERDCDVPPEDAHRAFNRQPIRNRVAVLAAGPAFNFLFAVVAYWCMFLLGVPGIKPVVGEITPDSYASRGDLRANDEIVQVGSKNVSTWEGALLSILEDMLDDGRIGLRVLGENGLERNVTIDVEGEQNRLTEPGALLVGIGINRWQPVLAPRLGEIQADSPAQRAGFRPGDLVVAAQTEAFESWSQWVRFVRDRPGQSVDVQVERGGEIVVLALTIGTASEDGVTFGRIGAGVDVPAHVEERMAAMWSEQHYGPLAAVGHSVRRTWEMSALTVRLFGRMLTGDVSLKAISGPINIAQFAGATASIGAAAFLSFLGLVSISLGILNLLPIPVLDGGQLVYQAAEWVKGSPLSPRTELIGQQVGIALLLVLMSFAFYNDIARLMG